MGAHQRDPVALSVCHRPKQSLGQNFLADANICRRIVGAFRSAVEAAQQREQVQQHQSEGSAARASGVVEVGPGTGALTRLLYPLYPDMLGKEVCNSQSHRGTPKGP